MSQNLKQHTGKISFVETGKRKRKENEMEFLVLCGAEPTIQLSQRAASEMMNHSLFASLLLLPN